MMRYSLNPYINPYHGELFQATDRELIVRGGAHAGKTYSIAAKLLLQSIVQSDVPLKALVIKKTQPTLKDTVMDILGKQAEAFKLPFKPNLNNLTARCGNMQFLFRSMNNQEDYKKIKSYTDIDYIWINEITEIREDDYEMLTTRLRGGRGSFAQIVSDFNPVSKTSWVYERFYEKKIGDPRCLKYTVLHNPWATKAEIDYLKRGKEHNPNFYNIYFLGEWGSPEDVIYNWKEEPLPAEGDPEQGGTHEYFDEIFYGGDFGFSVDPAAVIKIYRKADHFWLEEILYEHELTNMGIADRLRGNPEKDILPDPRFDLRAPCYWDSAEPKSIQELYDLGLEEVYPAEKGPDSVVAGIDFLLQMDIKVVEGKGRHILREMSGYKRQRDKDNRILPDPIKFDNHAMDAIRYAIHTHCKDMFYEGEDVVVLG